MPAKPQERNRKLFLKIYTRKGVVFDDEIENLTSFNDTGEFDVLRQHAQFISKIKDRIRVFKLDGSDVVFPVGDAIMRVKGPQIEVFLGIKTA